MPPGPVDSIIPTCQRTLPYENKRKEPSSSLEDVSFGKKSRIGISIEDPQYPQFALFRALKELSATYNEETVFVEFSKTNVKEWILENKYNENVTELYLTNLGLTKLPEEIFLLQNLKTLDVSYNQIRAVSFESRSLPHLEELYVNNNMVAEISLKGCPKLQHINISSNDLQEFPRDCPATLVTLFLSNNHISKIPPQSFTNLKVLIINGNALKELALSFFTDFCNVNKLELNRNQLKEIPSNIKELQQLEIFHIAENSIRKLPQELNKISTLQEINCQNNHIWEYPDFLGKKIHLEIEGNPCMEKMCPC